MPADPITPSLAAAFDNTQPVGKTPPGATAFSNGHAGRMMSRLAFFEGVVQDAVFVAVGPQAQFEFDTPFDGFLVPAANCEPSLNAGIGQDQGVPYPQWEGRLIPAGTHIVLGIDDSLDGEDCESQCDFREAEGMDLITRDPADSATPENAAAFDSTPATSFVLAGEQSPVDGETLPASPTAATHQTTLLAGTNYLVQVGSRGAPVTVTLPDPGSLIQRIEIADASGQAATYNITVDGGTKDIETTGVTTKVINTNDAVLALYYTGTKWKIL